MPTTAIRLGIAALLTMTAIGCGSAATDLEIGDCFDAPTEENAEVTDVVHHECTEPHTGEVVAVFEVPGEDDAYPTDDAWLQSVRDTCVPAFNSYTGRDFDADPDWDIGYLVPTADGWGDGDREMSCYATRVDGTPTSGSIKAGAAAS